MSAGPTDLIGQAAEVGHAQDDARNTRGYMAPPARHQPPRARRCNQLNLNGRKDSGPAIANTNPTMVVDFGESHSSLGSEYIAHRAGAQPNLHLKGETPVILYDDAYYFWHPATSTFLRSSRECHVVGSPTAAEHWELRHSLTKDGPDGYYTFWGQELQGKRKMVLDLFGTSVSSGTRIGTWQKLEGDHQKWVLRSDGDEDGYVKCFPFPPFPHRPSFWGLSRPRPESAQR